MPNLPEALVQILPTDSQGVMSPQKDDRDYYDYQFASGVYKRLISGWLQITTETERQRDLRYVKDADSIDLRNAGIIKADELYTPVRLIDANIRAEQPSRIQYLTQSRRSIIFASPNQSSVDGLEKLETDFTTKARYLGWELPFIQNDDGAAAHGWDSVEIKFDVDKPGNFAIEHIGHDRLIFSTDSEDIEAQEVLAIKMMLTANQLRAMVTDGGFDSEQIEKLIQTNQKTIGLTDCINLCYKIFFKKDSIVNVCWFAQVCDDYLKAPEPLFMGLRDFTQKQPPEIDEMTGEIITPEDYLPIYESEFPIVTLKYIESSDPRIVELLGRVKLDEPSQEAASALQSGMVNGTMRASNIFGSPQALPQDSQPSDLPTLTNVILGNGRLFSRPMNFWHTPYPDTSVVQFLQAVVTQNKTESGAGPAWSVLNRKDSGKTATEVQAATQESTELSSVQVILMSIFIRRVYAKCWRIYQNRVLQGKIIIKDPTLLVLFGEDIQTDPEGRVIQCSRAKYYIIKSSGDVDVIQRQEKLNRLMQGWEVFGKTPIAMEYLKDIIRSSFPEDASRYVAILEQSQQNDVNNLKMLLQKTGQVIQALVIDPVSRKIKPEFSSQSNALMQLAQQIQMALTAPTYGGIQGGVNQQQSSQSQLLPQQTQ